MPNQDELREDERTALSHAQLLVVSDTSKRAVEIGFLAHRAFARSPAASSTAEAERPEPSEAEVEAAAKVFAHDAELDAWIPEVRAALIAARAVKEHK